MLIEKYCKICGEMIFPDIVLQVLDHDLNIRKIQMESVHLQYKTPSPGRRSNTSSANIYEDEIDNDGFPNEMESNIQSFTTQAKKILATYYRESPNGTYFYCPPCGQKIRTTKTPKNFMYTELESTDDQGSIFSDFDSDPQYETGHTPNISQQNSPFRPDKNHAYNTAHRISSLENRRDIHQIERNEHDPIFGLIGTMKTAYYNDQTYREGVIEGIEEFQNTADGKSSQQPNLWHCILEQLSPLYLKLSNEVKGSASLRQHFGSGQGWRCTVGLSVYSNSTKIIAEITENIKFLASSLHSNATLMDETLAKESPLFWSMQHITPQGLEAVLCEVDRSWYGRLVPVQKTRCIIFSTAIMVILLAIIIHTIYDKQSNTETYPISLATSTSHTIHSTHPSTNHTTHSTHPSTNHTTHSTHPSTNHTTHSTTLKPEIECNLSKQCETQSHWQTLSSIFTHDAAFNIKTIQDLTSQCANTINVGKIMLFYWENCLNKNPQYFPIFSNPNTPLTLVLEILQNYSATVMNDH